jgi:hypothetical protein
MSLVEVILPSFIDILLIPITARIGKKMALTIITTIFKGLFPSYVLSKDHIKLLMADL